MNWPTNEIQDSESEHPWSDEETGMCPHCGTINEPHYTFCRNCVGKLPIPQDA